MIDWDFVLESMKWSKRNYEEKGQKYLWTPENPPKHDLEYRNNIFQPKLMQFDEAIVALQKLKEIFGSDRFCEVCEKSVTPTFSTRLIQGQCRDWVEETEKCPGCDTILRHSQIRTDGLRRMYRW